MAGDIAGFAPGVDRIPGGGDEERDKGHDKATKTDRPDGPYISQLQEGDDSLRAIGGFFFRLIITRMRPIWIMARLCAALAVSGDV